MSACPSLTQRTPTGWIVSATQILFSWFLVWPLEMRVHSQRCLFLMLNWTYICTGVQCNMEYENAPLCKLPQFRLCTTCFVYYINSWMYTESQILEYIQLFFLFLVLFCKIITATSTTLYKNQPHCPNQASLLARKLYGVMKTTICNIISHYSHYWRKSSGQKEINTYTTIW